MTLSKADQKLADEINAALDTNPRAVEKAMWYLASLQTDEELSQEATLKHNNVGFSSAHARFGAYCYGILGGGGQLYGKLLNDARKVAKRYARTQLLVRAKQRIAYMEARKK